MRLAGSKAGAPPSRLDHLGGPAHHELVGDGGLPFPGPQEAPDSLDVLALPLRSTYDDRDLGFRHVDALVEGAGPLRSGDVARDRHEEVLACYGVRGCVVGREDQYA